MNDPEANGDASPLLSSVERSVLSTRRIQLGFVGFTLLLLIALSSVVYLATNQIFATLSPAIERDLSWKARHSTIALSADADLAILTGDSVMFTEVAREYLRDPDVLAIVALDGRGNVIYRHGDAQAGAQLFAGAPRTVQRRDDGTLTAWAATSIEGVEAGKVALVLSRERVAAGDRLKQHVLQAALAVGLAAFAASLLFARFYITPIVRIAHGTIARLEQMTLRALEATRLKSEFLANVSHEIRTPMNGILAMSELLTRSALADKQRRLAEVIFGSARSLLTIVNDVLDISKIEAGKYELHRADYDLDVVVRDALELLSARALAKGIVLELSVDEEVPRHLRIDGDRLRQLLLNLLGNAVKFTDHGKVTLAIGVVHRDGARATLRCDVTDTGPGITPEGLAALFQPFTQVDGSSTRKFGGTGLGLAISKQLAQLMGGEIGVETELGVGSTFWFTFEAEVIGRASIPAQRAVRVRALMPTPISASLPRVASTPPASVVPGGHVLAVDDNEINQLVDLELLGELGLSVEIAANGAEAVAAFARTHFDAVLMDCQMPIMDGYTATREIRAREQRDNRPRTPIVALTAHAVQGERAKVLAAGMDDYVTKPIERAELLRVLARHLPQLDVGHATLPATPPSNDVRAPARDAGGLDPSVARSDKLILLFLELVPRQIEGLVDAAARGDAGELRTRAHKLKGSCASVGARAMSAECESVERAAAAGDASTALAAGERLCLLFEAASAELERELRARLQA